MPAWAQQPGRPSGQGPEAPNWFYLTDEEARFLTAAADRIIPKDEWPSASEAGVVQFIDLQLATSWGHGQGLYSAGPFHQGTPQQGYQLRYTPRELYREGIARINAMVGGNGFAGLSAQDQDAFLTRLEKSEASLGDISGQSFFTQLRNNVIEGWFSDPWYNGNRGYAGWRMIGFPGAHAYYLTEVDRHGLEYDRPPTGMAWQPGLPIVPPFTPRARAASGG